MSELPQQTIGRFLEDAAAKSPAPGGGAVASVTAALGTSLGRMVLNFSQGRKSLAAHDALHSQALRTLEEASQRALDLAQADADAYGALNALWKLDKNDPRRIAEWDNAVADAIDVPRQLMQLCQDVLALLESLVGKTNAMLNSDLAIAAVLAEAALRAGAWNVRINLPQVTDASRAESYIAEMTTQLQHGREIAARIEHACAG